MERKANSLFGKKIRKAKKGCLKMVGIQVFTFSYIVGAKSLAFSVLTVKMAIQVKLCPEN
jgi:hypothetical protein